MSVDESVGTGWVDSVGEIAVAVSPVATLVLAGVAVFLHYKRIDVEDRRDAEKRTADARLSLQVVYQEVKEMEIFFRQLRRLLDADNGFGAWQRLYQESYTEHGYQVQRALVDEPGRLDVMAKMEARHARAYAQVVHNYQRVLVVARTAFDEFGDPVDVYRAMGEGAQNHTLSVRLTLVHAVCQETADLARYMRDEAERVDPDLRPLEPVATEIRNYTGRD